MHILKAIKSYCKKRKKEFQMHHFIKRITCIKLFLIKLNFFFFALNIGMLSGPWDCNIKLEIKYNFLNKWESHFKYKKKIDAWLSVRISSSIFVFDCRSATRINFPINFQLVEAGKNTENRNIKSNKSSFFLLLFMSFNFASDFSREIQRKKKKNANEKKGQMNFSAKVIHR